MIAGLFDAYSLLKIGTYKPSSVVEVGIIPDIDDKLLGCEERIAVRAARVEHMCKKLTQEGSKFKEILQNTEVKNSNVWIRHNLFMEF